MEQPKFELERLLKAKRFEMPDEAFWDAFDARLRCSRGAFRGNNTSVRGCGGGRPLRLSDCLCSAVFVIFRPALVRRILRCVFNRPMFDPAVRYHFMFLLHRES